MAGTVILTGANGSLALGFVESFLALYPQHTLVAAVRNASPEKDPNTAKLIHLISKHPKADVRVEALDLGNLAGVRAFTDKIAARVSSKELPRISAIICNASAWSLEAGQKYTSDGYDASFQVCHLAHYLLVLKLLGSMDTTAGRVVMLGSVTHYAERPNPLSSLTAQIPDKIEELVKPKPDPPKLVHDRGFQRYASAKLANVLFMGDLNRRLQEDPKLSNITVTAMDPGGLTDSRAQTQQKAGVRFLMAILNFLMPILKHFTTAMRASKDSGQDLAALSLGTDFQGKRGYYVGLKKENGSTVSQDQDIQRRLWEACWRWSGLRPEETALQNASKEF
ncbi:uncharacterized protein BJX67DRAFT_388767 [Aspergillus lucknowensis]|uniref:Uncharacterized protein n=1 Tax=Aspergillus lucknowensis TaxID=176173 RepID=A0ABR4LNG4_9EURO